MWVACCLVCCWCWIVVFCCEIKLEKWKVKLYNLEISQSIKITWSRNTETTSRRNATYYNIIINIIISNIIIIVIQAANLYKNDEYVSSFSSRFENWVYKIERRRKWWRRVETIKMIALRTTTNVLVRSFGVFHLTFVICVCVVRWFSLKC